MGVQLEGADPDVMLGEILEVSGRGLVLSAARGDNPPDTIFYPWRVIRFVQLDPRVEEAQTGEKEKVVLTWD